MRPSSPTPLLAAAALVLCACPSEQQKPSADDRLIAKLKAEQDRLARGGAAPVPRAPADPEDPNAHLANLAAAEEHATDHPLPSPNPTAYLGTVALKLAAVKTSHNAGSGKVQLTTEDLFVEVDLAAQNVGKAPQALDFEFARLVWDKGDVGLARDAQHVAGTRELKHEFGVDDRTDFRLLFEAPREAFGHELALLLPAASGAGTDKDLKVPLE